MAQQQTGRQRDGSYIAPTGPGSEIYNGTHGGKDGQVLHPPDDTKGQCVTACKQFSGITARTTAWQEGAAVSGNSSIPIGTAIATFGACRYSYTCRKRARRHEFSLLPVEIFL